MSTTVRKSLRVLELLAKSDTPRGVSELSREVKLDKSAVQRFFRTLAENGYIEKAPGTSRYRPTLRLWELGALVIARNDTRRLIHPILRYAAKVSGLTAYFAWAAFPDVIYLDKVEGEKGRPNSSDPGQRIPMYAAASGRAILAFLGKEELRKLQREVEKSNIIEFPKLLEELRTIQHRLFASSERGATSRINSIAAPVWSAGESTPIGSIVLTSDSATLPKSDFDRIGAIAQTTAEQGTRALGGHYPSATADAP